MTTYSLNNIISEIKRSSKIGLPMVASELGFGASAFIATVMVAHLNKYELAANALGWGIYLPISLFFMGIYCAVSILGAQSFGAKDDRGMATCFKQGIILACMLSIPMMLIIWFAPVFMQLTGQDPIVTGYATQLMHTLMLSAIPFSLYLVMHQFVVATGRTRVIMWMSLAQVPIEIFAYYVFIFGKFGIPKFGVAGVGYGMTTAVWTMALVFGIYLFKSKHFAKYNLFQNLWHWQSKFFWELLRVGLPLGFLYCIEVTFFAAIALMMGVFGTNTLAAYQISYQFLMIGLMFIFGMIQGAGIRVGHEVGRNDKNALKLAAFVNVGLTFGAMFFYFLAFILIPHTIIGIDINIHAKAMQPIVKMATSFLAFAGVLLLSDSIRLTGLGVLRSMKDTKFPVLASTIGFWCIAFPSAYIFAFKLHWGGNGIWLGIVIGLFITGMMLVTRFFRLIKRVDLSGMITK